ncbi:hypothetical protein E4V01_24250 [Methylorubrum sp. Q1]|uniref:hypothetical protein n=1 Tax=Methylorubrum sp. Q1 TaxID=2562453 RepID=UPI00107627A3|nr:hypothetical protein [Methylorubrum sp. Q1]TFZ54916.1 hypothetical protein E4V01_24250 [Methylorubrum sp. Q1]
MDLEELFFARVATLNEERDCAAHTVALRVTFAPDTIGVGTPEIIAGLLRVLATHVDGYCAVRATKDAEFRNPGMVFHFTDPTHRDTFVRLCTKYLRERAVRALTFADL